MDHDFGPHWPRLYSEAAATKARHVTVAHRPFAPFSRAEQRHEFIRQMPAGWTLTDADKRRSAKWDRGLAWFCCTALVCWVAFSIYLRVTTDMPQPAVAVTANK